jgi:sec-independent protein translocase protein TatA
MLLGFLQGSDLLIVLAIVALLFGGSQLPKLARSLGSASHEFKKAVEEGHGEGEKAEGEQAEGDRVASGASEDVGSRVPTA